jgi:hypothetical protein
MPSFEAVFPRLPPSHGVMEGPSSITVHDPSPEAAAAAQRFLTAYSDYERYPANILFQKHRRKLLEAYRRHHEEARSDMLLSVRRAANAAVPIYDFGAPHPFEIGMRVCKTPNDLHTFLGWPDLTVRSDVHQREPAEIDPKTSRQILRHDTKCRIM